MISYFKMKLDRKQQHQEEAYYLPYHWLVDDEYSRGGRLYFGYLRFCAEQVYEIQRGIILDAGCGDARFFGELVKSGYRGSLHGADYSERALELARIFVPQAEFLCADVAVLPYKEEFFDRVFLIETLEHIPPENISKVMNELRRVLKPEGKLIITVPSSYYGVPSAASKHYQHFTPASLIESVRDCFEVEKLLGQDRVGFHPLKIIDKLADNGIFLIKPLRRFYVNYVWKRYFNLCNPDRGRRLMIVLKKRF